jgi:hypothetical protein
MIIWWLGCKEKGLNLGIERDEDSDIKPMLDIRFVPWLA